MNKQFTVVASLAALAAMAQADKCYALAFSAGDQTAAYQAGVLKGLIEASPAGETSYSAISGVSGGAVNAAILASFAVGQEAQAASRMQTFWDNSANTRLYKEWPGGVTEGLLVKGGLYNNKPLYNFLATELTDILPNQRFVDVGLTNVLDGTYKDFFAADLTGTELIQVMFGSFAYAGFFAPEAAMGADWFDGSTIWDLDVFSAVNKCLETHAPEDIVLDVLLTSTKSLKQVDASNYKSIDMLWRYLHVAHYYSVMDGLLRAQFAYPTINFRHIISPSADLPDTRYPLVSQARNFDMLAELDAG